MARKEKLANLIKELGAEFLEKESSGASLITVTDCLLSDDLRKAKILFTVFPEEKEAAALSFAKRKRGKFREHLGKKLKTKIIPFIEVQIDLGEKHRQKIDELLREK